MREIDIAKNINIFVYFCQSYLIGECKQFALIYFDLIFKAPDNETLGLKLTSTVDPLMHQNKVHSVNFSIWSLRLHYS